MCHTRMCSTNLLNVWMCVVVLTVLELCSSVERRRKLQENPQTCQTEWMKIVCIWCSTIIPLQWNWTRSLWVLVRCEMLTFDHKLLLLKSFPIRMLAKTCHLPQKHQYRYHLCLHRTQKKTWIRIKGTNFKSDIMMESNDISHEWNH